MTDDTTGLSAGAVAGRKPHWERLSEADRHLAHIDAQMTLLRLRRGRADKRRECAVDMAVAMESYSLDGELRTLGQSVTNEKEEGQS